MCKASYYAVSEISQTYSTGLLVQWRVNYLIYLWFLLLALPIFLAQYICLMVCSNQYDNIWFFRKPDSNMRLLQDMMNKKAERFKHTL